MADVLELEVILPATATVAPFWIDPELRRPQGSPFASLPKVEITATEDETLRVVLGRAGDTFGIALLDQDRIAAQMGRRRRWYQRRKLDWKEARSDPRNKSSEGRFEEHLRFAAFVLPGDEVNGPAVIRDKSLNLRRAATIDAGGLVRWDIPPLEASIGSLIRASCAGLLDGDPFRPYLIVAVPAGDLGAIATSWTSFEEALDVLWSLVNAVGVSYSAVQAFGALKRRLNGVRTVVRDQSSNWAKRGERPNDLPKVLGARPRSASEVAALLGCQDTEAEALLWGLGFERGEDGLWRTAGDKSLAAEVLKEVRSLLDQSNSPSTEELREEIEAVLRRGQETRPDETSG